MTAKFDDRNRGIQALQGHSRKPDTIKSIGTNFSTPAFIADPRSLRRAGRNTNMLKQATSALTLNQRADSFTGFMAESNALVG